MLHTVYKQLKVPKNVFRKVAEVQIVESVFHIIDLTAMALALMRLVLVDCVQPPR